MRAVRAYFRKAKGMKFIHVKRRNLMRQFVSMTIMMRTHIHALEASWAAPSLERKKEPLVLMPEECERFFDSQAWLREEYDLFYRDLDHREVYYEDVLERKEETLARIQEFIGLSPEPLQSTLIRLNPEPLSALLANYGELKRRFDGTRWSRFFDE